MRPRTIRSAPSSPMSAWSSCPTRAWPPLAAIVKPERVVPAIVEFVDIAGLVAGASKGEGLGNQFLSHIRETDAIVNVVRCFDDDNVIHVAGKVDPVADIEVIQTELCLADLATVEKSLVRYHQGGQGRRRQGSAAPGGRAEEVRSGARRGPAGAQHRFQQGRAGRAEAALPDHGQAGDVRRQRRRGRLREQPVPRPPARSRRQAERAGGGDLRQDRGRTGRHERRRPRDVPGRDGPDRARAWRG